MVTIVSNFELVSIVPAVPWHCSYHHMNGYDTLFVHHRTDVIPSSRKPKPHERKMERRATVGFGLDKSSKKSRLIRWCQVITEDYDVSFYYNLLLRLLLWPSQI